MYASKIEGEDIVLSKLEETYRMLLKDKAAYCIDVEKTLETITLSPIFDIGGRSECARLKMNFSVFMDIVENQSLSSASRRKLYNRFRKALKEKLKEQKCSKESCKGGGDRQRMAYIDDKVRWLLSDLAAADSRLLLNGLGILVKDTDQFLSRSEGTEQQTGAKEFREILDKVISSDKKSPADATYEYLKLDETVPAGFIKVASTGSVDLSPLLNPKIINKAATSTGRKFLKQFMRNFKKVICEGSDSPYEKFKKGQVAAVPTTIATTILTASFSVDTFWYPLAVYLSLLITRAGLDTYCDKK